MQQQPTTASQNKVPNIVAIGGGTGLPNLLKGLKDYTPDINLTAIVTTFDDGGSSGILRDQLGIPALGDIRRCLTALARENQDARAVAEIFNYRFDAQAKLNEHSLGNLILASLLDRLGDLAAVVEVAAEVLNIQGNVIPVATQPGHLRAQLADGSWIESETKINNRTNPDSQIKCIKLQSTIPANPHAIAAIQAADIITAGPGDLYTSVIPNLLPQGIADAIRRSQADLTFICNVRNKPAETAHFNASDHVRTFNSYFPPRKVDTAILNQPTDTDAANPNTIQIDKEAHQIAPRVTIANLASQDNPQNHNPQKLAKTIITQIPILQIPVNPPLSSRLGADQ